MGYFEIPPEPEPHDHEIPPWFAAPRDELGTELAVDRTVAESPSARITVRALVAYSTGFQLSLLREMDRRRPGPGRRPPDRAGALGAVSPRRSRVRGRTQGDEHGRRVPRR